MIVRIMVVVSPHVEFEERKPLRALHRFDNERDTAKRASNEYLDRARLVPKP